MDTRTIPRSSGQWLSLLLLVLAICLGASPACATDAPRDLITQQAYWVDASAQATLDQARQATYTPYADMLAHGYTPAATWIRLTLDPPPGIDPRERIILRIEPIFLDEIQLFDPLDTSGQRRVIGDRSDLSAEEFPSMMHTLVVPAGRGPRVLYLRLHTTSTSALQIKALIEADMHGYELQQLLIDGVLILVLLLALSVVLLHWVQQRERLYGLFLVRTAFGLLMVLCFMGFHRLLLGHWLSGPLLDRGFSFLLIVITTIVLYFEFMFLQEWQLRRWARIACYLLLAMQCMAIVTFLGGWTQAALQMNAAQGVGGILTLLCIALWGLMQSKRQSAAPLTNLLRKEWLAAYYLAEVTIISLAQLPMLGVLPANVFTINGWAWYLVFSSSALAVLMYLHFRGVQKQQIAKDIQLALALQETRDAQNKLETERAHLRQQTDFMHMLTHELRTPLSVLALSHQEGGTTDPQLAQLGRQAIQDMNLIIERCISLDRIESGQQTIQATQLNVPDLLEECAARFEDLLKVQLDCRFAGTIHSDGLLLKTIVLNLLDNAHKYAHPDAPILLSAQAAQRAGTQMPPAEGVCITVANRVGPVGFPDPARVFTKFYRAGAAHRTTGTGLGLYIIHALCRLLGGDIRYRTDDYWVVFECWLPVAGPQAAPSGSRL